MKTQSRESTLAQSEEVANVTPQASSYGSRVESSASHESPKMTEKKVRRSSEQGKDAGGGVTKSNGRDKSVGPVTKERISTSVEDPEGPASGNARKGGAREGCRTGRQGKRLEKESQGEIVGEEKRSEQQEGVAVDNAADHLLKSASKER